jgi:23S rRNA (uracil1939-C5)-methyltransferase
VYDLYTGTGTIANFIARKAQKVVGIEYVDAAIEDARDNSSVNRIQNTLFYAGDIAKVLTSEFVNENGTPTIIITDPPRAGMHPKVIERMLEIKPNRIVYISCNPATQARDITLLSELYKISKVQPVDMFPHTQHVENIVLLEIIKK